MDIWFNFAQILFDAAIVYGFVKTQRLMCDALKTHKDAIINLYNQSLFGNLPGVNLINDIMKSNDKSLAFIHNNNLEMQKKILEKLEKIEKALEDK